MLSYAIEAFFEQEARALKLSPSRRRFGILRPRFGGLDLNECISLRQEGGYPISDFGFLGLDQWQDAQQPFVRNGLNSKLDRRG